MDYLTTERDSTYIARIRAIIGRRVVGREYELDLVLAAVAAGRDILIEGPPGTSKSTLLRAITESWQVPFVLVEGNADLTPGKLLGGHDPARVLREGYRDENFIDGPLLRAMRDGGFLYIEELNRAPDDTLNTLLTAMAEREVTVPRLGRVTAEPSFRVVASMNPYDNVGTTRLSASVHDRFNRLVIGYQNERSELEITALRTAAKEDAMLVADAVALTRATREHEQLRQGSSVRGAIDLTLVATQLLAMRGIDIPSARSTIDDPVAGDRMLRYAESVRDAAYVALSSRIHVDEAADKTPERIIEEIWAEHFAAWAVAAPG